MSRQSLERAVRNESDPIRFAMWDPWEISFDSESPLLIAYCVKFQGLLKE